MCSLFPFFKKKVVRGGGGGFGLVMAVAVVVVLGISHQIPDKPTLFNKNGREQENEKDRARPLKTNRLRNRTTKGTVSIISSESTYCP